MSLARVVIYSLLSALRATSALPLVQYRLIGSGKLSVTAKWCCGLDLQPTPRSLVGGPASKGPSPGPSRLSDEYSYSSGQDGQTRAESAGQSGHGPPAVQVEPAGH
jgi:hypothetical protein